MPLPPASQLAALPLDAQLDRLTAALPADDPRQLLEVCAALRDHAPLAWLCGQLLQRRWIDGEEQREWFARFLVQQPGTAVDKVLRALVQAGQASPALQPPLHLALVQMLRVVPLEALPSMCLVDRTLKHNFPEERDTHIASLVAAC